MKMTAFLLKQEPRELERTVSHPAKVTIPDPVQMCCLENKTDSIRRDPQLFQRTLVKSCYLSAGPAYLHWRNLLVTGKEGTWQKDR